MLARGFFEIVLPHYDLLVVETLFCLWASQAHVQSEQHAAGASLVLGYQMCSEKCMFLFKWGLCGN